MFSDYDYSNFYYGAGDDPLNLLPPFNEWYTEAKPNGYYLYTEPLQSAPTTQVRVRERQDRAGPRPRQPRLVQLPRHLLPRRR